MIRSYLPFRARIVAVDIANAPKKVKTAAKYGRSNRLAANAMAMLPIPVNTRSETGLPFVGNMTD